MHKASIEPSFRKRPAYHAMLLAGIAMITTAFLSIGDVTTRDTIALRLAEDLKNSLSEVIPPELHDNNLLEDKITLKAGQSKLFTEEDVIVYRAQKDNKVIASAFEIIGKGYAGDIHILVGISREAKLLGVRVISHQETPGLGDKIERGKSDWVEDFKGRSLNAQNVNDWAVKKDGGQFDQFSGATITPRAIVGAVRRSMEFYALNQQNIIAVNSAANSAANSAVNNAAIDTPQEVSHEHEL